MNRDRSKTVKEADARKQRLATDAAIALSRAIIPLPACALLTIFL